MSLTHLIAAFLLVAFVLSQPGTNCTNSYTSVDELCPLATGCCDLFQNCTLTNLTVLIVNTSSGEPYLLCVSLTHDLFVTSTDSIEGGVSLNAPSLYVTNSVWSFLIPESQSNITNLTATNQLILQQSNLITNNLVLSAADIIVQTGSQLSTLNIFNLTAAQALQFTNSNLTIVQLLAQAQSQITISGMSIINVGEDAIFATSGTMTVSNSSRIVASYNECDSPCSCSGQGVENCTQGPASNIPLAWNGTVFQLPNVLASLQQLMNTFVVAVIANQLTVNLLSSIEGSGIAVYANTLILANVSNISAQGLGCLSKNGLGCGYYDLTLNQLLACTGSGGSYGGLGGSSAPDTCTLLASRRTYGNLTFPTNKGSGGGNPLTNNFSAGGGLVFVQTTQFFMDGTSEINVDGLPGLFGGGGGSGGSINIQTASVNGASGQLSAQGGSGRSSGGGGRISLQFMQWANASLQQPSSSMTLLVGAGGANVSSLSSGLNGSIFTTPCRPGQQLINQYLCVSCQNGTFNPTFGYSACRNCPFTPNSNYTGQSSGLTSEIGCQNYTCNEGYTPGKHGVCENIYEHITNSVGGENILICIGLILASLVIYGLIVLFFRIVRKKDSLPQAQATEDNLKQFAEKPHFQIEELPYHEYRIYLSGSNTPDDPWHLSRNGLRDVTHRFITSPTFDRLIDQINQTGAFRWWHKALLYFFLGFYFPLKVYLQNKFRAAKAADLQRLIKRFQKDIPDWEEVTIKLTVKANKSVACLEIFNYQRSLYDFYLKNCFPLVFVLEKRPLGGYTLDSKDPFLKAMITYRDEKYRQDGDYISFEKYCSDLNEMLLQVPNMDNVFTHLAAADDYGLQLYLMQPPDNILNFYPKDRFHSSKELILVVVEEATICRHFLTSTPLPNFQCLEMQRLQWQLSQRQEQKNQLVGVSFMKQTKVRKIVWIWILGIINLFQAIALSLVFYDVMRMFLLYDATPGQTRLLLPYFYIILFPLVEFAACFILFIWCLKPTFKLGVYSMNFAMASLLKELVLGIAYVCQLNQMILDNEQVGVLLLVCTILQILLLLFQRPFLWTCRNNLIE